MADNKYTKDLLADAVITLKEAVAHLDKLMSRGSASHKRTASRDIREVIWVAEIIMDRWKATKAYPHYKGDLWGTKYKGGE